MPDGYLVRRGLVTAQHLQIIRRVASGKTNAQIGRELGITTDTVKSHLRKVYRRLGVVDRATLVLVAVKRGLINVDDYPLPPMCYDDGARAVGHPADSNT